MGIPNPDPLQPYFLRNLLTPQGMGSSGGPKVAEIELRVEGQEGIGDLGAHGGNQPGNTPYFIFIDVSRDQQRACDQEWRIRPPAHPSAQIREVSYRPLIAHSAKGEMDWFAPCLEVKLYTSPRFEGYLGHPLQKGKAHGSVGLPADPQDSIPTPFQSDLGCHQ